MQNEGFTHYYGRHKSRNKNVARQNVARNKTEVVRARVSAELKDKIKSRIKSESDLIRTLLENFFTELEEKEWQEELEEMFPKKS